MHQRDQNVTKRKKVSSICFNVPAAGLGNRPPSLISNSVSDDGGFNEPSPEIKAPLKPAYPFDTFILSPSKIPMVHHDEPHVVAANGETETAVPVKTATLNYVDIEHRVRPDGTESAKIYEEADAYKSANTSITSKINKSSPLDVDIGRNVVELNKNMINNRSQKIVGSNEGSGVVYAQIRPEIPPATELIFDETEKDEAKILDYDDLNDNERGYHSPQSMLDPTRWENRRLIGTSILKFK